MHRLWLSLVFLGSVAAAPSVHFPVRFEPSEHGGFVARADSGNSYIASTGAWRMGANVEMQLIGGSPATAANASCQLPGRTNDLRGADRSMWRQGIPQYSRIRFTGVWPGIDLFYHGDQSRLEYDFEIAPGASPDRIVLNFHGAGSVQLAPGGGLRIQTSSGEFRFDAPRITQAGRQVAGRYRLRGGARVSFLVGPYDHRAPLTIDPVLGYAAVFGTQGNDPVEAIAVDSTGNVYIAGSTLSEIPLVNPVNSKQGSGNCSPTPARNFVQCEDAYVAKFDPTGTSLLYSTYLGGDASDFASGLAVGRDGSVFVSGTTRPAGFPISATQGQAWVMKLNPSGSALVYNQSLGMATAANGVAVDSQGNAYVAGLSQSLDFPAVNGIQTRAPLSSLLVTHDGGATWSSLNQNLPVLAVNSLAIDPTHASTLYAATSAGLFQSVDAGANWKRLLPTVTSAYQVLLDPSMPSTVYALYVDMNFAAQIAKSTDGGANWQVLTANLPPPTLPAPAHQFGALAIDPNHPSTLWLSDVTQGSPEIYESTDGGVHWIDAHDFPVFFIPGKGDSLTGGQILVDATNSSHVYTCCAYQLTPVVPALFRTDDGGKTWVEGGHANLSSLALDPRNGATVYSVSGSTLFRSADAGQTWTSISLPPVTSPGAPYRGPAIDPSGALYLTNDAGILLRSTDGGATWGTAHGPWSYSASNAKGATILALDPVSPATTIYVGWANPSTVQHAFAAKLDPSGVVLWATLLAGSQQDDATAIAVDSAGNAYVAGTTNSLDFPLVNPAQSTRGPSGGNGYDAFLTKIASDGSKLVYSTYLGGSGDDGANGVAVDSAGNAYLAGTTTSYGAFPQVNGIPGAGGNGFAARFDPSGQKVLFSTYIPGSGSLTALTLDSQQNLWVAGQGAPGLPLVNEVQPSLGGSYLMKLSSSGISVSIGLSTYIGAGLDLIDALAATPSSSIWMAGQSSAPDFVGDPSSPPGFAGFLARLDQDPLPPATPGVPLVRAVYNSASFRLGDAVSPGEIVTLIGAEFAPAAASAPGYPLPQSLQGVSVTIGGVTAPLFYVSSDQINFQAPFELSPGNTSIVVSRGSQAGVSRPVHVIPFSPGIFASSSDTYSAPSVVHASDFNLVTPQNPAHAGEFLAIYCTGLGVAKSPVRSGDAAAPAPNPVEPLVEVVVDSRIAEVAYAGLAPGYAGLYQVNFQVSADQTPGTKPLTVTMLGVSSNPVAVYIK